jgi:hypothetical protein
MIDKGLVQGSQSQSLSMVINKDIVYVHTNIQPVKDSKGNIIDGLYEYHEYQFTLTEYMDCVNNKYGIPDDTLNSVQADYTESLIEQGIIVS